MAHTTRDIIAALHDSGFISEEGYVEVWIDSGRRTQTRKYHLRHSIHPIVLFNISSPWFYSTEPRRWIHADKLHEYIARLPVKKAPKAPAQ